MTSETHAQLASFIRGICNLLRGPYKRNEYRKVILPLTVLRRFDCLLAPTKAKVLQEHAAKTIDDPACGTGGMLSVAETYIRDLNAEARPRLFGQDRNADARAVCKSERLIKGDDADTLRPGASFTEDAFDRDRDGKKFTFDVPLKQPRLTSRCWKRKSWRSCVR